MVDQRNDALPWMARPRYYTQVTSESSDPVTVFAIPEDAAVSSEYPGTPVLHLEPSRHSVLVRDVNGHERGMIRSDAIFPRLKYVMQRDGDEVWTLQARSLVLKRHALSHGSDKWIFDTPFFWWQTLAGACDGAQRLAGSLLAPTKRIWFLWIEPGRDTHDLLAAVAFMHRNWWRL